MKQYQMTEKDLIQKGYVPVARAHRWAAGDPFAPSRELAAALDLRYQKLKQVQDVYRDPQYGYQADGAYVYAIRNLRGTPIAEAFRKQFEEELARCGHPALAFNRAYETLRERLAGYRIEKVSIPLRG